MKKNWKRLLITGGIALMMQGAFGQDVSDVPTELEKNMDALANSWYFKGNKELRNCKSNSVNPSFSEEVYKERLAKLPTVIDMPYNERVREMIDFYANKRRGQVERMLGLSMYYFPMFEQELSAEGLPLELKYLPIIESALQPVAKSRVGAAGLWQFMPATGRIYGLQISSLTDDRRDPYESTRAGAAFLKDLYKMFGDWHLAIAAYNCGPGNVNKAIRRAGGKRTFWEIYDYLPKETRGYVPIFIAANYIMTYYKEHNLCPVTVSLPKYSDTIVVHEKMYLSKIAKTLKMDEEALRNMNPKLLTDVIPGNTEPQMLYFPTNYANLFIANLDSIRAENNRLIAEADSIAAVLNEKHNDKGSTSTASASEGKRITHTVRSGQTLSGIADRYNVTVRNIKDWNNLKSNRVLRGQKLRIYDNGKSASNTEAKAPAKPKTYTVRRGDNLTEIAAKYGTTVNAIKKENKLKSTRVRVGQKLKIPAK
jgi:membrane-bound lytic murein transglycosylase D